MSYEATISSYGGNAAVIAKSFVMAVKNVAQTWYSSLRPGTITSWQKLKDMLVTSFQGFRRSQSQLKHCFNARKIMRSISRRMSEGSCV
jgi:predicted hydrolase (HD superfamily)